MTPQTARRRFVVLSALTWLPTALPMAATVLLAQVRGLDLAELGLVLAVFSISVAVLELPTGGLADMIGRRAVLAASAVITLIGMLWLAFATALPEFLTLAVLKALARALSTGPAEAWYVDTLHASAPLDPDELRRGLAAGNSAGAAALAVGTLLGGTLPLVVAPLLPSSGPLVPLSAPMLLATLPAAALLLVALLGMPEPPRPARTRVGEVLRGVPDTIRRGIRLGVRDRLLSRVLAISVLIGFALYSIEMLTPGRLAHLTGDPATGSTAYSVVAAIGFGAVSVGSTIGPRLARRLGGAPEVGTAARTAIVGAVLAAASLAGLAASAPLDGGAGIVTAAVAYAGMFTGLGIAGPVRSELLHQGVSHQERATVVSVDSLMLQFGGTVGALGLGALAAGWSVAPAWWLAATVLLGAVGLLLPEARAGRPADPPARRPERELTVSVTDQTAA
jgi:MFS family permease